jgi:tetratricopeptide (TPR) repeat protein
MSPPRLWLKYSSFWIVAASATFSIATTDARAVPDFRWYGLYDQILDPMRMRDLRSLSEQAKRNLAISGPNKNKAMARIAYSVAWDYWEHGNELQAKPYFESALALGKDDSLLSKRLATALSALAFLRIQEGNIEGAKRLYNENDVQRLVAHAPPEEKTFIRALSQTDLARIAIMQGDVSSCQALLEKAKPLVSPTEQVLASEYYAVWGHYYRAQGDLDNATKLYTQSVEAARRRGNCDCPSCFSGLISIAELNLLRDKSAEARNNTNRLLKIFWPTWTREPELPYGQLCRVVHAEALVANGHTAEGEKLASDLQLWFKSHVGAETLVVSDCYRVLGLAAAAKGDYATADKQFRAAIALREKLLGKNSPTIGKYLTALALSLYRQKKYSEVVPVSDSCIAAYKQKELNGNLERRIALVLRDCSSLQMNTTSSLDSLESNITDLQKLLQPHNPIMLAGWDVLASKQIEQKLLEPAEKSLSSLVRGQSVQGRTPQYLSSLAKLADVQIAQERWVPAGSTLSKLLSDIEYSKDKPAPELITVLAKYPDVLKHSAAMVDTASVEERLGALGILKSVRPADASN